MSEQEQAVAATPATSRQRTDLSQATSYRGSCEDMCPERERNSRLGQRTSIFERDPTTNISEDYAMVKEYRRAGADQEEPLPDDLRTPNALKNTVDYLVTNIMDDERSKSPEYALEWYDFLWDRLRAVRKDITQQNICNELSAILVEQCTRFHVHSCYALNRVKDFDVNMNKRNLNDCLQMLRQIYQDLKESFGITCMGEFEFKKYNILLHLGEDALTTNLLMKEAENRSMKEAKLITDLFNSYSNNDYFKFFKLMQKADYMTSCILSLYVNKMRLNAMKIILTACNLKQPILYPAKMIIESLAFDDIQDLSAFALHFEVEMQTKDSIDYLILKREHIEAFRQLGSTLPEVKSRRLVEDKMSGQNVGQLVYGLVEVPPSKPIPIKTEVKSQKRDSLTKNEIETTSYEEMDSEDITPPKITNTGRYLYGFKQNRVAKNYDNVPDRLDKVVIEPKEASNLVAAKRTVFAPIEIQDSTSAPRITRDFSPNQTYSVDEGDSIVLKVLAEGNPRPKQFWFKGTQELIERIDQIEIENDKQEYKLKIKQTNQNDSGKYRVVLRNELGRIESTTVELHVEKVAPVESESQIRLPTPTPVEPEKIETESKLEPDASCVDQQEQEEEVLEPFITLYNDERRLPQPNASRVSFVADLMPAGKLRRSKRLMPKFGPMPQEPKKVVEQVRKGRKESKRASDINSIKEWASEEERANQEFFRIVRLVI